MLVRRGFDGTTDFNDRDPLSVARGSEDHIST
jgi:hypothetical protein